MNKSNKDLKQIQVMEIPVKKRRRANGQEEKKKKNRHQQEPKTGPLKRHPLTCH